MNQIKSTAIVRKDIFILLKKISDTTGKSVSCILSDCFKYIISQNNKRNKPVIGSSIKYQKRNIDFCAVHYQIDDQIYETCLDLKKILKKSLSRIINETIQEIYSLTTTVSQAKTDSIAFYVNLLSYWKKKNISYRFRFNNNKTSSSYTIAINSQLT